jgi:hypothetical protein
MGEHVPSMRQVKNLYKNVVEQPEERKQFRRPKHR